MHKRHHRLRWPQLLLQLLRVKSKNQGNFSKVSLFPDKQNSSEVQQDNNSAVRTSQIESSSSEFPIVSGKEGTKANNHKDKPGYPPRYMSTEKSKHFTSPVHKSESHGNPSSHQVLEKKVGSQPSEKPSNVETQPSKKPSKQPSEQNLPTYHILWDGFDDPTSEPYGQNCHLCDGDLAVSPTGVELDFYILPQVAVLSCGHAFHFQCMELITSQEQSTDPPCFICSNGLCSNFNA